jgi:hypothetical protein
MFFHHEKRLSPRFIQSFSASIDAARNLKDVVRSRFLRQLAMGRAVAGYFGVSGLGMI